MDPEGLAALNRSGKNRVGNFLVLAFREIDRGFKPGLRGPSDWKNGAGPEVRRWADTVDAARQHAIETAKGARDTLPELKTVITSPKKAETALKRGRPGEALRHPHAAQGSPWSPRELRTALRTPNRDHLPALRIIIERAQKLHDDTKRGPIARFAERFLAARSAPRRLLREQRVIALRHLAQAYRLDTGREPTLVSERAGGRNVLILKVALTLISPPSASSSPHPKAPCARGTGTTNPASSFRDCQILSTFGAKSALVFAPPYLAMMASCLNKRGCRDAAASTVRH